MACGKCGSPFHPTGGCSQTIKNKGVKPKTGKSKWKTRKQLGLKPGELPFKFRVNIDPDNDGEPEVIRKRALLRLNSQRIYTQMGCTAQALIAQQNALRWMTRLAENMDESDQDELKPVLDGLTRAVGKIAEINREKIEHTVQMEHLIEDAHIKSRAVRRRLEAYKKDKSKKSKELGVLRLGQEGSPLALPGMGGDITSFSFPSPVG